MSPNTQQPFVEHEVWIDRAHPGVAIIRLNRPAKLNSLTMATMRALHAALDEIISEPSVRVIVLTGEGRGFCAGLDLIATMGEEVEAGRCQRTVVEWMQVQELFASAISKLRSGGKPVIAAVNGAAVGAGMGLALAADVRIASATASFHVGAVRIGLTGGECGISYHLPRHVGASRAFELMLTGRPVGADEAARIGLVSEVAEGADLIAKALQMADLMMRNSPYSIRHTKQLMWANLDAPSLDAALTLENHTQVLALVTQDFQEAVKAFSEKRTPVFRNC